MDEQALRQMSGEILTDIKEWRKANPRATYVQIEDKVHKRLMQLEARLIEGAVEESPSREWGRGSGGDAAQCPKRNLAQQKGVQEHLEYLCKREMLMQYPQFRRDNWPIGSGMVESANKNVVEARPIGSSGVARHILRLESLSPSQGPLFPEGNAAIGNRRTPPGEVSLIDKLPRPMTCSKLDKDTAKARE